MDADTLLAGKNALSALSVKNEQSPTVRQVRRFLSEATGFLQGEQAVEEARAFTLEQAMEARIAEIEGTPRNPAKPNRLARLNYLTTHMVSVIAWALALPEESLSGEIVEGFGASGTLEGVSRYLALAQQAQDALMGSPPDVADALGGKVPSALGLGAKAKDVFA